MGVNRPRIQTQEVKSHQKGNIFWRKLQDGTRVAELRWREKIPGSHSNQTKLKWKKCFKSLRGVNVKQAQAEMDAILDKVNAGNGLTNAVPAPTRITMRSLIENQWLEYTKTHEMRPSTLDGYRAPLKKIEEFFGHMGISEVTSSDVSKFMSGLADCNHSAKYRKNIYVILRNLFDIAFTHDLIAISPVKPKLHRPKVKKAKKVILPVHLWNPLLDALPAIWRTPVRILLTTGMRQGELFGLRWQDIDFTRRVITKTSVWYAKGHKLLPGLKTQDEHEVGMSDRVVRELLAHRDSGTIFNGPKDFVFCNAHGRPWNPETFRAALNEALDAIGFPRVSRATGAHMFRHTAASVLQARQGDLKMTAQLLGHSSIQTTASTYIHTDDVQLLKAADILSEPLDQNLPRTTAN